MTAKDVKFSIDRIIDPQFKFFFAPYYSIIKEATVVDEATLQIVPCLPQAIIRQMFRPLQKIPFLHFAQHA